MPIGTSTFVQSAIARTSDFAKLDGATRSNLLMACSSFCRIPSWGLEELADVPQAAGHARLRASQRGPTT
eukprot:8383630-Pyramimonas_sp.AAC.1